jgi:urease accessory protein
MPASQPVPDAVPYTEQGLTALLLLVDGRFPSGGHAHSGGLEAAERLEKVNDIASLETFLRGRLATVGTVAAAFAAATARTFQADSQPRHRSTIKALEAELDARTPSSVQRAVSRQLGRQLLRAGRSTWPHPRLDDLTDCAEHGPHQPVALGAVAAAAGLPPRFAALAAAHESVVGPATAAIRLLGLDPFGVHALIARMGEPIEKVAAAGARHAHIRAVDLPTCSAPLLDISAEHHATWEVRLFAS